MTRKIALLFQLKNEFILQKVELILKSHNRAGMIVACGVTHTSPETGFVVVATTAYKALETETTVR